MGGILSISVGKSVCETWLWKNLLCRKFWCRAEWEKNVNAKNGKNDYSNASNVRTFVVVNIDFFMFAELRVPYIEIRNVVMDWRERMDIERVKYELDSSLRVLLLVQLFFIFAISAAINRFTYWHECKLDDVIWLNLLKNFIDVDDEDYWSFNKSFSP